MWETIGDKCFHQRKALAWTRILVKNIFLLQTCSFWLHKILTDGLEWCGLLWSFRKAFWTLILTAPIHCRDPLVILFYFCIVWFSSADFTASELKEWFCFSSLASGGSYSDPTPVRNLLLSPSLFVFAYLTFFSFLILNMRILLSPVGLKLSRHWLSERFHSWLQH